MGHTFGHQANDTTILRLWWDGTHQCARIGHSQGSLATQHSFDEFYLDIDIQVIAFTLKCRVRFDADNQDEVATWTTTKTRLALTGHADLGAVVNASINLDLDALTFGHYTLTRANTARITRNFTCALTRGTNLR